MISMGPAPVLDAHMHLDPRGSNRMAVRSFLKEGGTHLIIIHKPYREVDTVSPEDHARSFDITEGLTAQAREEGAKAWCVIGPYPGDLPVLARRLGLERAVSVQSAALREAASRVGDGLVIGLGEIGRVHFPTGPEVLEACDVLLLEALSLCRDLDCCAVLHTDSPRDNPGLMAHLGGICDEARFPRFMAVKHYSSGDMADPASNRGLTPSVLATRSNLAVAISKHAPFLMETDYIDEPDRPNVVLPPDTVPKKVKWMRGRGILDDELQNGIMVDLPARALKVEISL